MKTILYLSVFLVISSCARFGKDDAEIVESVPTYMMEVFAENKNCNPQNSLLMTIGQQSVSRPNPVLDQYTDHSFTNFDFNTLAYYISKEDFYQLFPDFIPVNSSVVINSENYTVKDIFPKLQITSVLPKAYLNNLKTGSYILNNDEDLKRTLGFKVNLVTTCSLKESDQLSYCFSLNIDLKKQYQFNIGCIDKSDPSKVKISGTFEGTFKGIDTSRSNAPFTMEDQFIKASFSYVFKN